MKIAFSTNTLCLGQDGERDGSGSSGSDPTHTIYGMVARSNSLGSFWRGTDPGGRASTTTTPRRRRRIPRLGAAGTAPGSDWYWYQNGVLLPVTTQRLGSPCGSGRPERTAAWTLFAALIISDESTTFLRATRPERTIAGAISRPRCGWSSFTWRSNQVILCSSTVKPVASFRSEQGS